MFSSADNITYKFWENLGIKSGMRVLEAGSSIGNLTIMLAEMAGPDGSVTGIDFDDKMLSIAQKKMEENKITNVEFRKADLSKPLPFEDEQFDVIAGRRILMYLPNPGETVNNLARVLKRGGIIGFQEHDATMMTHSIADMPLHEKVNRWMWETVEKEGGDIHTGYKLWNILAQEGLAVEKVTAEAVVQTPNQPNNMTPIIRAMMGRITKLNNITEEEIDIETLDERLKKEMLETNTTFVKELAFCGTAKKI